MIKLLSRAFAFLTSTGLSCVLFLLLLLLTYLGTLYQTEHGLYQAQSKYFSSFFLIHEAFGSLPVPLPGGYLLCGLLFVNLLCGGIVRATKGWRRLGVLVAHGGILLLLVGSFISFEFALGGQMMLYEGESSDTFQTTDKWEITVAEVSSAGATTEYVIPEDSFAHVRGDTPAILALGAEALVLEVRSYAMNAIPKEAEAADGSGVIDGFRLSQRPPEKERGRNIPGAYVTVVDTATSTRSEGIIWGGTKSPLVLEAGGKRWAVDLHHRRWKLPFTIKLDDFTRELHPGTSMPSEFKSDVTRIEGGVAQQFTISMNEPLRHLKYVLYQSSWGPADAPPGTPLYSVFAVRRNPAEQFPLFACIIITAGLLLHFAQKLLRYLRREARKASAAGAALLLFAVLSAAPQARAADADHPGWDKETLKRLSTLPVQDNGRIKPLDTIANVALLKFNGKRSCTNLAGERITAIEWLADCLCYPEQAKQYKSFRVDNADVMAALGLAFEKKRDRYAYADLAKGRSKLMTLAQQYGPLPAQQLSSLQSQILNLAHNLIEFEGLCDYLTFARTPLDSSPVPSLAAIFPDQTGVAFSTLMAQAPAVIQAILEIQQGQDGHTHVDGGSEVANTFIRQLDDVAGKATALRIFPPSDDAEPTWLTPREIVQAAFQQAAPPTAEHIEALALLEDVIAKRDAAAERDAAIAALHTAITGRAITRGEYGSIPLEVSFYRAKFFYYSLVLYVFSFLLVALSLLKPRNRAAYALSFVSVVLPTLLLATGITMRCIIRARPPVTTLYETILFTAFVAVVVALFIEFVNRQRVAVFLASVLGALGLFIAHKYEIREGADTMPSMVAVLDTNFWLAAHVTTIIIGYGAGFLASALAHFHVLGRVLRLKRGDPDFYPGLARTVYGVLCFSLVFSIVGTVLGGIWANESWGRFWGWDPKENGALMIVLWQLAILHARQGGYIKRFGVSLATIFGGIIVAFSWFGVNLLGVGLHTYGFTSGVHRVLLIFYGIETLVIVLGACVWLWEDRGKMTQNQGVGETG